MSAQIIVAAHKHISLRFWQWDMWHNERWQKSAALSGSTWMVTTALLYLGINRWGHEWWFLIGWNVFWDTATYVINKLSIFGDRKVSGWSSGGATTALTIFCFAYHKATIILLLSVGLGYWPIRLVQAAIGVLENPLRFVFNDHVAFAEKADKA